MAQKRKPVDNGRGTNQSEDEEESEFELASLDDEPSSEEELSGEDENEADSENEDVAEESEEDEESSDSELLNGKSNGIDGTESENLLSEVSSEYDSSDSDVVLDADGNPRKLLPEIDPHYDSDSSTPEESNTIGDIDVEKYYGSMPHIGYDINGRRIMRPAAGAALDQLLDSIDLPKGWTGIIDKETGELKNLTEEELHIIKRIRREELPSDQLDVYDVTQRLRGLI
jgi:ribosome biogenesis protein ERB1